MLDLRSRIVSKVQKRLDQITYSADLETKKKRVGRKTSKVKIGRGILEMEILPLNVARLGSATKTPEFKFGPQQSNRAVSSGCNFFFEIFFEI